MSDTDAITVEQDGGSADPEQASAPAKGSAPWRYVLFGTLLLAIVLAVVILVVSVSDAGAAGSCGGF